ncbi:MAG TPA: DUF1329 domain-containing protein [Candidatus Limnocylindrales bacterium]|nr:DUF1329 domain-containing protein [Candidatus Limnocylindrales bacterium]
MRTRIACSLVAACAVGFAGIGLAQQAPENPANHAPTRADEPAVGSPEEYEVLRRLLGVPAPVPEAPEMPAASASEPEAPAPDAASHEPATAVRKKPALPVRKAVVRRAPRVVKPAAAGLPQIAEPALPAASSSAMNAAAPAVVVAAAIHDPEAFPSAGDVVRAGDIDRYQSLLGPSVQWALLRGATLRVTATKPIPMEDARAEATQRYHDQVTLTPDRRDMRNFVAGIPFPLVQAGDPDAAIKIVFNQQSRLIVDDMDARKMGCEIGTISSGRGFERERTFQIEHWRRLYYVGRLYHEPRPSMPNIEGIRYRELQYPLIEPFDLKGGGWNFIRYTDVHRPDDGWIYYPVMRRVRRLSTAQRSQGIFGQDMDLDSYTGYAGNPAWMDWRLVGSKKMLASMHSEHVPVHWQAAPADFAANEPWEMRDVYVLEGRSLLPEYAFARRVVYVDKESWLVPYTEIYDDQGKLWKALHQTWGFGTKVRADAGGRSFEEFYLPGYVMIDMQIDHITRCELPLHTASDDKGWYYNYGESEGTVVKAFDIAGFLQGTH